MRVELFLTRVEINKLLLSVMMVMLLAFETFNPGLIITKIKFFYIYTNAINFFCNKFWDLLFGNFNKLSKTRPKVLDL